MPLPSFDSSFASPAEWARLYRNAGVQVVPGIFPMRTAADKRPALANWKEFHDDLVAEAVFERWFPAQTHPNMGLITGRASGNVIVVDLDTYKSGQANLWWDYATGGIEPETWKQTTGGGGQQVLLRAPPGLTIPNCTTSMGVDIRGQGGYAILPPTMHMSGQEYRWDEGCEPWSCAIMDMPQDMLEAIQKLVGDHPQSAGVERTPSPDGAYDAFGHLIDGREKALASWVWKAVLELHRRSVGVPDEKMAEAAFKETLELWERNTRTRVPSVPNAEGLEREGRGRTEMLRKWQYAMKQWNDRVAKEAAQPSSKKDDKDQGDRAKLDQSSDQLDHKKPPQKGFLTGEEFIAGYKPPDYVINGIVQRGYLYSLTARTGHGKTAVAMYLGQCVARGLPIKHHRVKKGSVVMLAGENPDDILTRYMVLADTQRFVPKDTALYFHPGVIDIKESMDWLRTSAAKIPDLMLVIVDTAQAYFRGDDNNSNAQMAEYARLLRELTVLPGKPAVIVCTHPTKAAGKENLVPVGGGAFLNEVDGNLSLWRENDPGPTVLHFQGKFRGPEFEPIIFNLDTRYSQSVVDSDGAMMPSIVASPTSDAELEASHQQRETDENILLAVIGHNPSCSVAELAKKANWFTSAGEPYRTKVRRTLKSLHEERFITFARRKPKITTRGKEAIGWKTPSDDDWGG